MKFTSEITITDAHMHLPVNYETLFEKKAALLKEMQSNGISRGVVISDSELKSAIGSLKDCAELFEHDPEISVIGGISPYIRYEEQLHLLEDYLTAGKVVGIKLYSGHEPIYLNDSVLRPVYNLAAKYQVPVLFHSGWDSPQYSAPGIIQQTVNANPHVRFVCCHCCYPDLAGCFRTLSAFDNLYYDISSIADSDPSGLRTTLEAEIRKISARFIFGSDFGSCSQKAHLDFVKTLNISEHDFELLLHGNADRLYFSKP